MSLEDIGKVNERYDTLIQFWAPASLKQRLEKVIADNPSNNLTISRILREITDKWLSNIKY